MFECAPLAALRVKYAEYLTGLNYSQYALPFCAAGSFESLSLHRKMPKFHEDLLDKAAATMWHMLSALLAG